MTDLKRQLNGITDRATWAARGASFMAKVKATKAVWFPPNPGKTGRKAVSTASKKTSKMTKKKTATAKKATSANKLT